MVFLIEIQQMWEKEISGVREGGRDGEGEEGRESKREISTHPSGGHTLKTAGKTD